jgi:GTP cyclohydrolase I
MSDLVNSIKNRIKANNGSFHANDNISEYLMAGELETLQKELEKNIQDVLDTLIIDTDNDHNTNETSKRVAKMYLQEIYAGRYLPIPKITEFPNAKHLDELYTLGPITIRSTCSHHLVPITGRAWIGIVPSDRVIGISKFVRLTNWVLARPQIQEEATVQLADIIENIIKPRGMGVVIEATHQCMTMRGVKENDTKMTTSVMRGLFYTDNITKSEFLRFIK